MRITPTHPHARVAVQLAAIHCPQRAHVARELNIAGAPRSLYTLARVLRAAQMVDQMDEIDRINAALPAVVARAA